MIRGLKIELTSSLENLPPAFVPQGGASRRQVAPLACLCGRKEITKEGEFLPLGKGSGEGFHKLILYYCETVNKLPSH